MTENEIIENAGQEETPVTNNNQVYIDAIQKLKSESVSKAEYERLQDENRTLIDSLVNGTPLSATAEKEETVSYDDLWKSLFKPDHKLNDMEFAENALALREYVLKTTGDDIFAGESVDGDYSFSGEDFANALTQTLEDCNGDPIAFSAMFGSKIIEPPRIRANKK